MLYPIKIKGKFYLKIEDILKFHPELKELLKEISDNGWSYEIYSADAEVLVELDLDNLKFNLSYHPPPAEDYLSEGCYEIRAEVGEKPPAIMKVLSIKGFELNVFAGEKLPAVRVDPVGKRILWVEDVLWRFGEGPRNLKEAREVYKVAKWFVERKGYTLSDEWVTKKYKKLVEIFEKLYTFTLKIRVTVRDVERVPGWEDLKAEVRNFFWERGMIAEIEEGKGLDALRKPLP